MMLSSLVFFACYMMQGGSPGGGGGYFYSSVSNGNSCSRQPGKSNIKGISDYPKPVRRG